MSGKFSPHIHGRKHRRVYTKLSGRAYDTTQSTMLHEPSPKPRRKPSLVSQCGSDARGCFCRNSNMARTLLLRYPCPPSSTDKHLLRTSGTGKARNTPADRWGFSNWLHSCNSVQVSTTWTHQPQKSDGIHGEFHVLSWDGHMSQTASLSFKPPFYWPGSAFVAASWTSNSVVCRISVTILEPWSTGAKWRSQSFFQLLH